MAGMVYISASPFVLQNRYGLPPQRFSLVFGGNALGLALMSQLSARLVQRRSPRTLLAAGLALIALAGAALLGAVLGGMGLPGILPALFMAVSSLGLITPNATALALATTETRIAGSASALFGVVQFSLGAILAPLVGIGGMETALPMAAAIAGFGVLALATFILLCRPA